MRQRGLWGNWASLYFVACVAVVKLHPQSPVFLSLWTRERVTVQFTSRQRHHGNPGLFTGASAFCRSVSQSSTKAKKDDVAVRIVEAAYSALLLHGWSLTNVGSFDLSFPVYCLRCDLNALSYINIARKDSVHIYGNKIKTCNIFIVFSLGSSFELFTEIAPSIHQ